MFEAFCKDKLAPLTLRLALGLVCIYHGFTKIMATGGLNWNPALPLGWQFAIAWIELGAGLAILLGFHCRLAAALLLAETVAYWAWWQGGRVLQMPWRTLETPVLLLLIGLSLLFLGAGELSLDARSGGGAAPSAGKGGGRRKAA